MKVMDIKPATKEDEQVFRSNWFTSRAIMLKGLKIPVEGGYDDETQTAVDYIESFNQKVKL